VLVIVLNCLTASSNNGPPEAGSSAPRNSLRDNPHVMTAKKPHKKPNRRTMLVALWEGRGLSSFMESAG
jgi:hypothetical protein